MQAEVEGKLKELLARIQKDKPNKEELFSKIIVETINPSYQDILDMDDEVRVHAEMKTFPEKLVKSKAPNQHPDEFNYIKESYQPETLSLWHIAESNTNRIFNPQNYSIKYKREEEQEYFTKNYPNYNSIESYFDSIVRGEKLKYANAVLAVKPSYIPLTETEIGGEKSYKIDDTKALEPVGVIYKSNQVLLFEAGKYAVIQVREKSEVLSYDKPVKEGLVFEIYDQDAIYRVYQYGKKTEWLFDTILYYQHNYGKLPVFELGGEKIAIENTYIHASWFYKAVPVLNQVVYDTIMLNASKAANAYPEKYEYVFKCSASCDHGRVPDLNSDLPNATTDCSHCKGSGFEPRNGLLGVYQIPIPDKFDNAFQVPTPPAGYIDKNAAIMEFIRSEIDKNTAKAFRFLGIDVSDSEVKGSETALGKIIDREALFSALRTIANELFDLLENVIAAIGFMRWGTGFQIPDINRPTTFAIRTYQDITEELSTAATAQLPEMVIDALKLEYMQTRFSATAEKTSIYNLISKADSLQNMSNVDINAGVATGNIPKWQAVLHINIHQFIELENEADPGFMEMKMIEKINRLQTRARDMASTMGTDLGSVDNLLSGVA